MDFSQAVQNIKDIFSERQKALFISGILLLFFCAALIAIVLIPQNKTPPVVQFKSDPLEADQELLLPQGVSIPQEYAASRETKEKWTEGQALEWFSAPDSEAVKKLSAANDYIVQSITEAAP